MYTIDEVAKITKKNPATVRKMARDGNTKFFKFGGEWRITKEDLNLWIEELKEKSYRAEN